MSEYTRYLKCPEHGIFEASFKTCPQCFPDEDTGDEFEAMKDELSLAKEFIQRNNMDKMFRIWLSMKKAKSDE